jgi:enterochelin esterase family protein
MSDSALIACARSHGNPVLFGDQATFVWQGKSPVFLVDDLHDWEENPQVLDYSGRDLWTLTLKLPPKAYLEYAFLEKAGGQRLIDPLNPHRVWNGMNAFNQYFYMPKAAPSPFTQPRRGIPHGSLTRFEIPTRESAAGKSRSVLLYRPPVEDPVPLLVVFDGPDYVRLGRLSTIVDNLLAAGRVQPFAMALVQNGRSARYLEYSCSEATLNFLLESILPFCDQQLNLESVARRQYGILGSSMGGLMALYTGLRLPEVFPKVLCQSGAFILGEHVPVVQELLRHGPRRDIDLWMDAGRFEWLRKANRATAALLRQKKYRLTYHEYQGGHNFTAWRDDLWHGLVALYA